MKIKVIKMKKGDNREYCHECGEYSETVSQGVTKWNEISDSEYVELNDQVAAANSNKKSLWHYIILIQVEEFHEIYETAAEFIAAQKEATEKRKIQEMEFGKRRDKVILERKKKQYEKLQKELAEFNAAQ